MAIHLPFARIGLTVATGVTVMALAACGSSGDAAGSPGSSTPPAVQTAAPDPGVVTVIRTAAPATTTSSPTNAAVSPPAPPPPTSASPTSTSTATSKAGTKLATKACGIWKMGDRKSAAVGSGFYDRAASSARSAAKATPTYTKLASDMAFVAGLPLTSNTSQDIARAQKSVGRIATSCQKLGVAGIVGN